jgi:hypothetical protein
VSLLKLQDKTEFLSKVAATDHTSEEGVICFEIYFKRYLVYHQANPNLQLPNKSIFVFCDVFIH